MASIAKIRKFVTVTENDLNMALESKFSRNTKRNVQASINILNTFFKTKNPQKTMLELTNEELDALLGEFYLSIRKINGDFYKKATMDSLFYNIKHYFREKNQIDLNSIEFHKSNSIYTGLLKN
jgi:hypothetical protein